MQMPVSHAAGRAPISRIQHGDAIAHALRCHGEHAPELAASEEAQHCSRHDAHNLGSVIAATRAAWVSRNSTRSAASFVFSTASIATANSPALDAPASPIAKVATG